MPLLPRRWRSWANKVETDAELNSLRRTVKRGFPFGDDNWTGRNALLVYENSLMDIAANIASRKRGHGT